jgi:hypothetical protein
MAGGFRARARGTFLVHANLARGEVGAPYWTILEPQRRPGQGALGDHKTQGGRSRTSVVMASVSRARVGIVARVTDSRWCAGQYPERC